VIKKIFVLSIVLSLCLPATQTPAYSAIKAGGTCKKVGVKSISSNKTFTCIKSGKKLVWDKGKTSVVAPVLVIPDSWPIEKTADKNIFLIADKNFRKFQQANKTTPKLTIKYGPDTDKKRADQYLYSLYKAADFWNTDWKYEGEIVAALGTSKDYSWLRDLWSNFGLTFPEFLNNYIHTAEGFAALGAYCNHGAATFGDSKPFFWGCMPTQGDLEMIGLKKFSAHEYTHIAHYGIMGNAGMRNLPTLISEGSADYYGLSLASDATRINEDWNTFFAQGFTSDNVRSYMATATSDQIRDLLIDSFSNGSKLVDGHWYYTGAYVTLRMIAAQGHDGFVNFMKAVKETSNAGQSFEKIYGIKFEDFAKTIAPEISALAKSIKNR
jgi:hypothetical protein